MTDSEKDNLVGEVAATREQLNTILRRLNEIDRQAKRERRKSFWHRVITTAIAIAVVIGLLLYWDGVAREKRVCEAVNESNEVLLAVLTSLAQPREDDEPGEFDNRQELLAQVSPLVQPIECR